MLFVSPLSCNPSGTNYGVDLIQQIEVGIADTNRQLPVFFPMSPRQRNRPFTVNQSCKIGCLRWRHSINALVWRHDSGYVLLQADFTWNYWVKHGETGPMRQGSPRQSLSGPWEWWRRRDSDSTSFDVAWTMPSSSKIEALDAGRIIRLAWNIRRILVLALLCSASL